MSLDMEKQDRRFCTDCFSNLNGSSFLYSAI